MGVAVVVWGLCLAAALKGPALAPALGPGVVAGLAAGTEGRVMTSFGVCPVALAAHALRQVGSWALLAVGPAVHIAIQLMKRCLWGW